MHAPLIFRRSSVAAGLLLLLAGCTTYEVKTDAIARGQPAKATVVAGAPNARTSGGSSFWIKSRNRAIPSDDLRFKEAASHMRTALSAHGLWQANDPTAADMVVEMEYGIDPPHTVEMTRDVPVYGPDVHAEPGLPATTPGVDGTTRLGATSEAGQDFIGFVTAPHNYVVYEKHLSVTCRENHAATAGKPPAELWVVTATIEDPGKDLREYMPVLAAAVMEKIGQTTNGIESHELGAGDDAIKFVKSGM